MTVPCPPLRSTFPAADIKDFFTLLGQYLQADLKTFGQPDGLDPILVQDFPKERLSRPDATFNVITHHVLEACLAPTGNNGRTPRAPVHREVAVSPTDAGYNQITLGWAEQATVQFEVWGKTNDEADLLARWFHRFLMRTAYQNQAFLAHGIEQFQFVKRLEDIQDTRESQELSQRPLVYTFRYQYVDTYTQHQLTDLSMNVSLGSSSTGSPAGAQVQQIVLPSQVR